MYITISFNFHCFFFKYFFLDYFYTSTVWLDLLQMMKIKLSVASWATYGIFLSQGCLIWAESGSDWPWIGQNRDFFWSDSASQNVQKMSRICPIWGQSDPFSVQIWQACSVASWKSWSYFSRLLIICLWWFYWLNLKYAFIIRFWQFNFFFWLGFIVFMHLQVNYS